MAQAHQQAFARAGAACQGFELVQQFRAGDLPGVAQQVFGGFPQRIVLAGEVDGIYTADPLLDPAAQRIPTINPASLAEIAGGLGASHGVDVTGGMRAKVVQALAMVERLPGLEIVVCSGMEAGHLQQALAGAAVGTRIHG